MNKTAIGFCLAKLSLVPPVVNLLTEIDALYIVKLLAVLVAFTGLYLVILELRRKLK